MRRRPPMSTRTDTLLPDATLFGSAACAGKAGASSSTGFALTDRSSASSPCLGTTRFPAPSSFDEGCSEAEFPSSGSHGFGGVTGVPPPSSPPSSAALRMNGPARLRRDRTSVVSGKRVLGRVDHVGRRIIKKKYIV